MANVAIGKKRNTPIRKLQKHVAACRHGVVPAIARPLHMTHVVCISALNTISVLARPGNVVMCQMQAYG